MKKMIAVLLVVICMFSMTGCGQEAKKENGNPKEQETATSEKQQPESTLKAEFTLKVANASADDSSVGKTLLEYFKPYVEEHSNGRISVEIYNNGVLGGDRQMYEAVQLNTVQANVANVSTLSSFCDDYEILDVPFLFEDQATAWAALDGEFGKLLGDALDGLGMRMLGFNENSFRNISNNIRPITSLEDMNGLKIRVMESPVYMNTMSALGANGTPISFNELYTALQQKTVDGQDNGIVLTYTSKLYEVLKYYTFTEHCYTANGFVISEEFWKSLPEDLQKVVQDGVDYFSEKQRKVNNEMADEYLKEMEAAGVEVNSLSTEEKERWKEATKDIIETMKDRVNPEIYKAALTVNEDY